MVQPAPTPEPVRVLASVYDPEEIARNKERKLEQLRAATAAVQQFLTLMTTSVQAPTVPESPPIECEDDQSDQEDSGEADDHRRNAGRDEKDEGAGS